MASRSPRLPKTPDVVGALFATDVGVDNEALQVPPNGYLCYDVTGITPARDRTLDEVKDQVAARWRDDEIAKRLQAKADDMLTKLKAGATLAQIATENNLRVDTAADMTRGRAAGFLPVKVTDAAFKLPKGSPASVDGDKATERYVIVVTDVTDPTFDANAPEAKQLTTSLQNSFADDIVGQYIAKAEADIGVTLNQAALNQVVGGGTTQQITESNADRAVRQRLRGTLQPRASAGGVDDAWSPIWRRRSRPFSSSAAASR